MKHYMTLNLTVILRKWTELLTQ